ncbi:MAG: LysE family translocator [Candidatus Heimdallarchaeota archaeon]
MVSIFETWVIVAALGFTLAVPLGPINVEIIKTILDGSISENTKWIAAVLTGIGAMTGDFLIAFSALTIGGEILINLFSNPLIRLGLFTLNVLILGYLGISALISHPPQLSSDEESPNQQTTSLVRKRRFAQQYVTGFSLVVTSPLTYGWWISVGTLILFSDLAMTPDLAVRLLVVIMFLSGILAWVLLFPTLLSIVGRLPNPSLFQWITKGTALILLYFAGIMLTEAWKALLEVLAISGLI